MTTVKDIAKIIATRYDLSSVESEIFMQMIVEVINDGLLHDRQVKIKGFGTFKLQAVKERSSVNVNTGEKVVIAEHDKISFVPDAVMKDLINKPFAQFETVVVENDNLLMGDVDSLEQEISDNTQETHKEDKTSETWSAKLLVEEKTSELQSKHEPTSAEDEDIKHRQKDENVSVADPVAEENEVDLSADSKSNGETKIEASNVSDVERSEHHDLQGGHDSSPISPASEEKPKESEIDTENEECEHPYPRCRNIFVYYGVMINVVVALIFFSLGYMASAYKWFVGNDNKATVQQVKQKMPVKKVIYKNTTDKPANKNVDSAKVVQTKDLKQAEAKEEKKIEVKTKTDSKENSLHDYDDDIRVKTGAYYIIGTEKVITVKDGQTLENISRSCLGEGMECYIEAYNGIKSVKKGDKIRIPKLKLKKIVNKK